MAQRRGNYARFFICESTVMAASMAGCMACFERIVDAYLAADCAVSSDAADASRAASDAPRGLRAQSFEACCRFQRAFEFDERMEIGLRLAELGEYSVQFELALFPADTGGDASAAGASRDVRRKALATGSVVRVFIANHNNKPVPIRGDLRRCLMQLQN